MNKATGVVTGSAKKIKQAAAGAAKAIALIGVGVAVKFVTDKVIADTRAFGAAVSDLAAITGASGKDLKFLSDASREFGSTTTLSATEAAEAFKLIASAKPDLLENVEALKAVTEKPSIETAI